MNQPVKPAIERARELLRTVHHGAMATVNDDGSPLNTPVYFVIDPSVEHIYWCSNPESQHQGNLARDGRLFLTVYRPNEGGGLYFPAANAHELAGDELEQGLEVYGAQRIVDGKPALKPELFIGVSPQRLYRADIIKAWTNQSEKDSVGNIIKDHRLELSREQLLG
jgi:hypothetical protein